ncbi:MULTISPECIES: CHASE domain-containing protein [Planktothricoides]|uniref:CHASE domain-containing protein n=2 Tax=Planktothricoides raciborskii TaxID=132608 RepID=A0AAU8JG88_9CYAN|nr:MULTISPECIES: CHASE domain-containing protein [Planktothricoides]KOR36963.1 hypothetical protein AM228_09165 [Planktothricoides sp. SR001]MBD2547762.1 CHASE domain-containing protein [Planktothricoides raciborskii FACHB-1370]MBD2584400.1 CHASE domain-containing protein [Planktothricoides raciborskii FACHB-1261]
MYPPEENDQEIAVNLLRDEANSSHLFRAIASRKMKVTQPLELDYGMMKIVGYLPVFVQQDTDAETFWGLVIVEIQIADLLEQSRLNQIVKQDYAYQLEWVDPESGDRGVFARSQNADLVEPISYRINVANGAWILVLSPTDGWGSKTPLILEITFILAIGLAIAYLVARLLKQPEILQEHVELRVADLSNINQQLTAEIPERQRIEQALRESEERFRAIADATPIPLVISRFSDGLVL